MSADPYRIGVDIRRDSGLAESPLRALASELVTRRKLPVVPGAGNPRPGLAVLGSRPGRSSDRVTRATRRIARVDDMTADQVIAALDLRPHPEGGHYRETWRDEPSDGGRGVGTAIYFLLDAGQRSRWHRVDADELWLFHAGAPLRLTMTPDGDREPRDMLLGTDLSAGQMPQARVPAGWWQAAEAINGWTLVTCIVTPAFTFDGFELADGPLPAGRSDVGSGRDVDAHADDAAAAFRSRMVGVLNDGMLTLGLSLGHRVGLFDVLADVGPATSETLADAAHLDERYVRELLGALVVGDIVVYDPRAATYRLPAAHAAAVTRSAGGDNMATLMQFVPLLAQVESDVAACVRHGGGVGYDAFADFHRLSAEDTAQDYDEALVSEVLSFAPGLLERLHAGIDVADIGCGSGHILTVMAELFPASRFTGQDISADAVAAGRALAARRGADNATFEVRDAAANDQVDRFDLITTFDAIHDQVHPDRALSAIATALRPDGIYLCLDIRASSRLQDNLDHPMGPFIYVVSTMHCMTVSLAAGGAGLGAAWGWQQAEAMIHDAGFDLVNRHTREGDAMKIVYVATRSAGGTVPSTARAERAAPGHIGLE